MVYKAHIPSTIAPKSNNYLHISRYRADFINKISQNKNCPLHTRWCNVHMCRVWKS